MFRHEFVVTPDGVLTTLTCNEDRTFGLTVPLVVDDGRALQVSDGAPRLSVSYPKDVEPSGDEQNFLLVGDAPQVAREERIRSAVGWLEPVRVTGGKTVSVFVYPRSAGDPEAPDVLESFRLTDGGFQSCLGRVEGNLYRGRTSAGGRSDRMDLDANGTPDIVFDAPVNFVVQLAHDRPVALETDRSATSTVGGQKVQLEAFVPLDLSPAE